MPIMKWDGAAYLEDVRRHLRSMNCLPVRAMITDGKKAKEIADYLKSVNKNHGGSGYGDVSMYDNTSSCIELKYNKALNDEGARTLTITWNQAAREIMRMFEEGAMHDPDEDPMQEQALKPGDDIEYDVDTSHLWGNRLTFDELRQMTGELVIVKDFWFPDDTKELDGEGEVLLVINADEDAVTLRRSPTETVTIERGDMDEIDSRKDCIAVWSINSEKEEEPNMNEDKTTVIVSEDYTRAVTLTRNIIANAQAAQQSLYEVCKGLKEVRDSELFRELGYSNFEDYCNNEVEITYRQAKKYVAIASGFEGSQLPSLGTEKLYLLAKLDEPTREAVTETIDVESVTVKELKEQITTLTAERDEAKATIETKDKQFRQAMDSKNNELTEVKAGWKRRSDTLLEKIAALRKELEEARAEPQEVAVEDTSRVEELQKQLEQAQADLAEANAKLAERPMVQEALPVADTTDAFKAYMSAAADSMRRLLEFVGRRQNDPNREMYLTRIDGVLNLSNTELAKLKGATSCQ